MVAGAGFDRLFGEYRRLFTNAQRNVRRVVPASSFESLPAELLLEILRMLSLSSSLSLSRTCSKFRHVSNIDTEALFEEKSTQEGGDGHSLTRADTMSERFTFLCMLERDGRLPPSKATCNTCKAVHDISLFSPVARRREQRQRECLGHEGRLWICPHRIYSFSLVESNLELLSKGPKMEKRCNCLNQVLFLGTWCITVEYPLLTVPKRPNFSWPEVMKSLKQPRIRLCPHLRSSDQIVVGYFHLQCPRVEKSGSLWHRWRRGYSEVSRCKLCRTSAYFKVSDGQDTSTLKLLVYRHLGKHGKDVNEPQWIAQLAMPEDFPAMEKEWQASSMNNS